MPPLRGKPMKKLKLWVLNRMFEYLFPIHVMDKVLTYNKQGYLYLNGVLLSPTERSNLQNELRYFQNTQLWDILSASLKHQAQKLAFNESKDVQDLLNAKMILYTISVQENILKKIDQAK